MEIPGKEGVWHPLEKVCALLGEVADEAGKAILEVYNRFEPSEVIRKEDHSPLTEADLTADKVIARRLRDAFPGIAYFSEETGDMDFAHRQRLAWSWLVDPLDGTREFIRKNGEFTVNIALLQGERVVAGVVAAPAKGRLYWAWKGGGAWRKGASGPERLSVSSFSRKQTGLRFVASRSHRDPETEAFVTGFREPAFKAMGSSLKILLLASGEADVYPRFAPTMEWDTAAAQIILEEAGGHLLDAETGRPLAYNKPDRRNPYFIAWGGVTDLAR